MQNIGLKKKLKFVFAFLAGKTKPYNNNAANKIESFCYFSVPISQETKKPAFGKNTFN